MAQSYTLAQIELTNFSFKFLRTLLRKFHREGQGFILVYSITARASFDRLEVFRQLMLRVKRNKPIFILVGNKCDKGRERQVTREEGQAMANQFGCEFLETSAKTAQNVERLFTNLVRSLRSTRPEPIPVAPTPPVVVPRPEPRPRKRGIGCIII